MLSREKAQSLGVGFAREDDRESNADPDVAHFDATITRDNHTFHFEGRSEEHVLEQVETWLKGRGEL